MFSYMCSFSIFFFGATSPSTSICNLGWGQGGMEPEDVGHDRRADYPDDDQDGRPSGPVRTNGSRAAAGSADDQQLVEEADADHRYEEHEEVLHHAEAVVQQQEEDYHIGGAQEGCVEERDPEEDVQGYHGLPDIPPGCRCDRDSATSQTGRSGPWTLERRVSAVRVSSRVAIPSFPDMYWSTMAIRPAIRPPTAACSRKAAPAAMSVPKFPGSMYARLTIRVGPR